MGCRPTWAVLALSLPRPPDSAWVDGFARGLGSALANYRNFERQGFPLLGVFDSDPEAEYKETVHKSNAIRRAAADAARFTGEGNR